MEAQADFDELRQLKWEAGREERGLEWDDPFMGDPIAEAQSECIDLANYIDQAVRDGRFPRQIGAEFIRTVYGLYMVLGTFREE